MADYTQLNNGLIVPADYADSPAVRPDFSEIATTADGKDITRGFVESLPTLQPQDKVLRLRGSNYEIYQDLLTDHQVASTFQQRRLAVTSREWEVIPGGTRRQDKRAADFLRETLDHISWDSVTDKMLYGVFYGYAVSEMLWARDGAQIILDRVKVRKQRRFAFSPDGELRLLTSKNPTGEALPERKFWHFSTGADNDDEPYGLGLAHWLYWPVFFKKNGVKFWLIFLEKFGMPTARGTYPTNATSEERKKLLEAVRAIQTDSGIILPEGMAIELIEAARSGKVDYGALCDRMDQAVAKVVLSQVMTSEVVGGQYKAEVQNDVRGEVIKADADLICQSFNRSVVTWLTEWNFPGADVPRVWRILDDPEDLNTRAERDFKIYQMGFQPTLKYITDTYDGEWEARQGVLPPSDGAPAGNPPPEFAEHDDIDDVADSFARRLDEEAAPALEGLIEPVRELVMNAADLDELRDGLLALAEQMDIGDLAGVMQQAFAAANLAGRFEANEGK